MRPPVIKTAKPQQSAESKSLASINPLSSIDNWLDALAVQLDGPKSSGGSFSRAVNILIPEEKTCWTLRLSNGALTHRHRVLEDESLPTVETVEKADLSITMTKDEVYKLLSQGNMVDVEKTAEGDTSALRDILELCEVLQSGTAQQSRL